MASLLGDIGGTNARFAIGLADSDRDYARTYRCADYRDLASIIDIFLSTLPEELKPRNGAICVAGPVKGPKAEMTNLPWSVDADQLRVRFGLEFLFLVNDFTAQAMAIPHLDNDDLFPLDCKKPQPGCALAVLGPGTGLGVSALVPTSDGQPDRRRSACFVFSGSEIWPCLCRKSRVRTGNREHLHSPV